MNETLKQNRLQRDHVEGSCSYVTEDQSNANHCPNKVYLYKLHCFLLLLHIGPLYLVCTGKICSGNHILGGNMEINSGNVFRSLKKFVTWHIHCACIDRCTLSHFCNKKKVHLWMYCRCAKLQIFV